QQRSGHQIQDHRLASGETGHSHPDEADGERIDDGVDHKGDFPTQVPAYERKVALDKGKGCAGLAQGRPVTLDDHDAFTSSQSCPVSAKNTSSRSTAGPPPIDRFRFSGVSRATNRPPSMIAIRSQRRSA